MFRGKIFDIFNLKLMNFLRKISLNLGGEFFLGNFLVNCGNKRIWGVNNFDSAVNSNFHKKNLK